MTKTVIGVATSRTSRAKGAREYFAHQYESGIIGAYIAARADHPRKKLFELVTDDGWNMSTRPVDEEMYL